MRLYEGLVIKKTDATPEVRQDALTRGYRLVPTRGWLSSTDNFYRVVRVRRPATPKLRLIQGGLQ